MILFLISSTESFLYEGALYCQVHSFPDCAAHGWHQLREITNCPPTHLKEVLHYLAFDRFEFSQLRFLWFVILVFETFWSSPLKEI